MRAGAARATITPALGTHLSGYGVRAPANAIHDELSATALVLQEGETLIGLLACDLVGLPVAVVRDWRPYLAACSGVPATNILIACSHTHAGPVTGMLQEPFGEREQAYREHLKHALAGALTVAAATLRPARISLATAHLRTQRNRRDGLGGVAGPLDDTVSVMRVDALAPGMASPGGAGADRRGGAEQDHPAAHSSHPLATVVHYASHPVALREQNFGFSADYVGWVRQALQQALEAPCLFLQGACGDLVPVLPMVTVAEGRAPRVAPDIAVQLDAAKRIGQAIGKAAVEAAQARPGDGGNLAPLVALGVARQTFTADLALPVSALAAPGAGPATPLGFEVQCLRLGPLAIVGLPVEPLCAVGQAIQRLGPFPSGAEGGAAQEPATIWCAGYANGCYGYLPPEGEYARGGYEVARAHRYYGQPAAFAPHTAAQAVAAAAEGLAALFGAAGS
jgi:neutral ceramidase